MLHSHRQKLYIPLSVAALAVLCLPSVHAQALGPDLSQSPNWVYTPWTKTCGRTTDGTKQVCSIGKIASDNRGIMVASAAFIEVEGEQAKTLRITVPMLDYLRIEAPQVSVDYEAALQMPPPNCPPSPETSCVSQSEATADLIGKLKHGQRLIIIATSQRPATGPEQGPTITFMSYVFPLSGFAEANESPATLYSEGLGKKLQEQPGAPTAPFGSSDDAKFVDGCAKAQVPVETNMSKPDFCSCLFDIVKQVGTQKQVEFLVFLMDVQNTELTEPRGRAAMTVAEHHQLEEMFLLALRISAKRCNHP